MGATVRTGDFSNIKERGNFNPRRKREGDYFARIVSADDHESKNGNEGWVLTISVDGDARAAYPYYLQNDPKQLWKVREIFTAAGFTVPKKRMKIDLNKVVGKSIGISLEDDEYDGRTKSTIAGVFPTSDLQGALNTQANAKNSDPDDEDDEYEEEEAPPAKKRPASKRRPEPEPEEDDEEDDEEEDTPPPPRKRASKKPAPPVEEDEEDDADDEEDEEEPPAKKAPAKKAAKKAPAKKRPVEDDEDDDLDLEDL